MTTSLKAGLLALGVGLLACNAPAHAAVANHLVYSNAVNYCQAFTPGITNTIRNRVIGAENIGDDPIAVACNFPTTMNGAAGNTRLTNATVYFSNGAAVAQPVTCTLLAGTATSISAGVSWSSTKTTGVINPGFAGSLAFSTTDNPTAGATDMGNYLVGVNCTLPKNMTMAVIVLQWSADNGV